MTYIEDMRAFVDSRIKALREPRGDDFGTIVDRDPLSVSGTCVMDGTPDAVPVKIPEYVAAQSGDRVVLRKVKGTWVVTSILGYYGEDAKSVSITTAQAPLATSGTDAAIISMPFSFAAGWAYEISWSFRFAMVGGSGPYAGCAARFRRLNASGTIFYDSGLHPAVSTSSMKHTGSVLVKVTTADTTQTIAMCSNLNTTGGATALNVNGVGTTPTRMTIRPIGPVSRHPTNIEIPTA